MLKVTHGLRRRLQIFRRSAAEKTTIGVDPEIGLKLET
jgi:hypothetical protein